MKPFEHATGCHSIALAQGYQSVLVTDCLFSGWIEAFPCRKTDALSVVPTPEKLEHVIST